MLKIIIDTNVIISAIISSQSPPAKILNLWREDQFELITTPEILEELTEVIFRPIIKKHKKITDSEVQELLIELQDKSTYILPATNIQIIDKDPADDKFIVAAVDAQADYIISGDKHLLELGKYQNIKIITPKEFIEVIEK